MSENMNNVEEMIDYFLEKEFGSVHEAVDMHVKFQRQTTSLEVFTKATSSFIENPSPTNYNVVITAMLSYQYWTNKKTNFEGEKE